jgi:hypothetical protein
MTLRQAAAPPFHPVDAYRSAGTGRNQISSRILRGRVCARSGSSPRWKLSLASHPQQRLALRR